MGLKTFHSRREFLKTAGLGSVIIGLQPVIQESGRKNKLYNEEIGFTQTPLPYNYNGLEPAIDAMTMEIHYTKHANAYAKNLADAALAENVNTQQVSLSSLLQMVSKFSSKMRNNAGGHYNHELFWRSMTPTKNTKPSTKLAGAISKDLGSMDALKTQFSDAAKNRFGSGWAWLYVDQAGKLKIGSTPNQDNPLMDVSEIKGFPILGLDVWEHAYYLKYQNRRPDYITAFWDIINWDYVSSRFDEQQH